jgi:hypothetical protein
VKQQYELIHTKVQQEVQIQYAVLPTAGEYAITISAPETTNYEAVTKEVELTINKAQATIDAERLNSNI